MVLVENRATTVCLVFHSTEHVHNRGKMKHRFANVMVENWFVGVNWATLKCQGWFYQDRDVSCYVTSAK